MSSYAGAHVESLNVRIYPTDSVLGRRWTLIVVTLSATVVAAAIFCIVASMLVGRRTPSTTSLTSHYSEANEQNDYDNVIPDGLEPKLDYSDIGHQEPLTKADGENYDVLKTSEPDKLQLLESLFPSHQSDGDPAWAESKPSLDRELYKHAVLADETQTSSPGIIVDDTENDTLSLHSAVPKHRKRVLQDQQDYRSAPTIYRLTEFPRRGKIRRRQHTSGRRRHFSGRRDSHREKKISTRKQRRVGMPHEGQGDPTAKLWSKLPINVAVRLLKSRHSRSRHRHSDYSSKHKRAHRLGQSKKRRSRTARTPGVVLHKQRRRAGPATKWLRRRSGHYHTASSSPIVTLKRHRTSQPIRHSVNTSHEVDFNSSYPAARNPSSTLRPVVYRIRRSLSASRTRVSRDAGNQRRILEKLLQVSMSDEERKARNLTSSQLDELFGVLSSTASTENFTASTATQTERPAPTWRVELSHEQKTFVAAVVAIAVIVAVGTLIFACVWCFLDQDGLCPAGWCNCLGTPKDTFSPQRWWMEALAQRVENLEAGLPLMERKGRRKKGRRKSTRLASDNADEDDDMLPDGEGHVDSYTDNTADNMATNTLFYGLADNKMLQ